MLEERQVNDAAGDVGNELRLNADCPTHCHTAAAAAAAAAVAQCPP
jgi:hypothetical protein